MTRKILAVAAIALTGCSLCCGQGSRIDSTAIDKSVAYSSKQFFELKVIKDEQRL